VKTETFLMKTTDNTHVQLANILTTSYEIFKFICQEPGGSNSIEFFLTLRNAMKAAHEATDSVMIEGQKSIYRVIPHEDLKQSIESKVRNIQAQERCTLSKCTPAATATKGERAQ
ncbi:hypothetical protein L914_21545, partial [Phytophthora nicotianae]